MPLDSITMSALVSELTPKLMGAKIDKVQQPERDTILLSLRGMQGNFRLALCGGVGNARVHITSASYENPQQPPMFCMLLRKHLVGARISGITQPERERIMILELDGYDEMGSAVKKRLAIEMIGRGTNIILVGPDGRIIDSLRRVDSEMSAIRQVLPGLIYRLPLNQTKPDFFAVTSEERRIVFAGYDGQKAPDKWLLDSFACLSPIMTRELVYRTYGDLSRLPEAMDAMADSVLAGDFTPCMLLDGEKPKDFSFMRMSQYGDAMKIEEYPDFSSLLDAFYTRRSKADEMKRRTTDLRRSVKTAHDRTARKLAMQRDDLKNTQGRELKRRYADLITANLYRMKTGDSKLETEDFYEDDWPMVTVPLDRLKTPQQNAAAYYKEYNKLKTAERYLTNLIEQGEKDERYLASVLDEIDRAQSESDIADIRFELMQTGYIRKNKTNSKERYRESKPWHYVSSSGFDIYVGRSNVQNDRLTFKNARKNDIWLHVQKIHGSHVIIVTNGEEVDDRTIEEAASLAAYHSQDASGAKVAVDFTEVRYVKKPAGALPGMVIFTDQTTIIACADEKLAERLRKG